MKNNTLAYVVILLGQWKGKDMGPQFITENASLFMKPRVAVHSHHLRRLWLEERMKDQGQPEAQGDDSLQSNFLRFCLKTKTKGIKD